MSVSDSGVPECDDYTCRLDLQSGWVVLTLDSDLRADADELARKEVEQFNPLKLTVRKGDLSKEMSRLALEANKSGSVLTGAYYTDTGVNLANLEIDVYRDEGVYPTPADIQPLLQEWKDVEITGEPDVAYLDLPAGPAVRVQATFRTKGVLGFGRRLIEIVRFAVCPPTTNNVVVVTVRWEDFEFTEELTELTDGLMPSLTLIPLDENGNEIDPESRK
ncbi:hypothetical protein [Streptomyces sp. H27-D2]|uniref:hypothetical protein n=1 Tax=Streptomyces sp. H27-D2 TaxID=3046304 RepID=UPI002DBFAD22|nr:hypothetical protein [Streptomyces sp. H27-D2]MEC4016490.1 hypothetical protein [Streptomyces sp. H27-D2]